MIPNQLTFLQKLFTSCVPFLTFSEFAPCPLPSGCLAVRCIYFTPSPELRMMKQPEKDDERSVALTQKQFFFFLTVETNKENGKIHNEMHEHVVLIM